MEHSIIDFTQVLMGTGVLHGLLLLLPLNLMSDDDLSEFLGDDGFTYDIEKHGEKKFVFNELDRVKAKFREVMSTETTLEDKNGKKLSFISIMKFIDAMKIQINKLRLIIDHEYSYGDNTHKPTNTKYVVARTYWIDNKGKKYRKFTKTMGPADKVKVNGVIPDFKKREVEQELDAMMWNEYLKEYKHE